MAVALGVSRQAVHQFVRADAELSALVDAEKERVLDLVERSLVRAAMEGESWATCFFLKTQAKHRGYVERQETHDVTARLELAEEIVDAHAAKDGPPAPRSG